METSRNCQAARSSGARERRSQRGHRAGLSMARRTGYCINAAGSVGGGVSDFHFIRAVAGAEVMGLREGLRGQRDGGTRLRVLAGAGG